MAKFYMSWKNKFKISLFVELEAVCGKDKETIQLAGHDGAGRRNSPKNQARVSPKNLSQIFL
jgi:hypothetical protein